MTMVNPAAWIAFVVVLAGLLVVDLRVVGRGGEIPVRVAAAWSAAWIVLALLFGLVVRAELGATYATKYLTGYLFEKGLAIENVYFLAAIFAAFAVPLVARGRLLLWTALGALGLRALFITIAAGVFFDRVGLIVAASLLLIVGGVVVMSGRPIVIRHGSNPFERLVRRVLPLSERYDGAAFVVRDPAGRRRATPLLPALVAAMTLDLVVSLATPVILVASKSAFLVFASEAFAVLGLRALFFLLAPYVRELGRVKAALGGLLVVVGVESMVAQVVELPPWVALAAIAAILALTLAVLAVQIRRGRARR